jgi:hypothetical protein
MRTSDTDGKKGVQDCSSLKSIQDLPNVYKLLATHLDSIADLNAKSMELIKTEREASI